MDATAEVATTAEKLAVDDVNPGILDALTDLVKRAGAVSQSVAARLDLAPSDLLALFKLDGVMTMKELAQRMMCDASFITGVADTLERHGLARREPSARDRRVKNLVLTREGIAVKERMLKELVATMPWGYALDENERRVFLALLEKMRAAGLPEQPAGKAGTG